MIHLQILECKWEDLDSRIMMMTSLEDKEDKEDLVVEECP